MFDDPRKELQALEEQLLAAEEKTEVNDEEFQRIYAEVLAEFGPAADVRETEPPIRNFANGYGRNIQPQPPKPVEVPHVPVQDPIPAPVPKPRRQRVGCLVFVTLLEVLVAAGLVAFWLVKLR